LISFRYHLVSIVAVFLALALGVLVGTTVVNQGVVDDLNRRVDSALARSQQLRDQVASLQTDVRSWDTFGRTVEPVLISDQLPGRRVVMVTLEGVDLAAVDGVRQALVDSGATVESVLFVTPKMALADPDSQARLASILGVSSTDPSQLAQTAAQRLAGRLAAGLPPAASASGSEQLIPPDLLAELVGADFLAVKGGNGSLGDVGAPDQAVVVLAGGSQDAVVEPGAFLEPFTAALAVSSHPVVAAESVNTVYPFVPLVREDAAVNGRVVTVDNADTMIGQVALVLGLRDLLATPSQTGHYGVKPGANSLIPKP
jgi:hypothetical protein